MQSERGHVLWPSISTITGVSHRNVAASTASPQSRTNPGLGDLLQCIVPTSKTGMSNVRPAGRMRPAKGLNAARKKIFLYVMHVARERI